MRTPTDSDLRLLDAADTGLTVEQQQRATALLERIVSTPLDPTSDIPSSRPLRHRRSLKLMALLATAAAIAVAMAVLPGLGRTSRAYATWTSTPSPVTANDLGTVTKACRDQIGDPTGRGDHAPSFSAATIPVALAERRGDLVMVLFHQNDPDEVTASCVGTNVAGSAKVDELTSGISGGNGPAGTPAAGRLTGGAISGFGDVSVTDGAVGPHVTGVTIHSAGLSVTTTVNNGRYAAWWPGDAFTHAPAQPDGQGGPQANITYDITLDDGTTLTNVTPQIP